MTRVGPDTPGGEYLRRFWQPVILRQRTGRPAQTDAHPRRGSRRLQRQERRHRPVGAALPASRHVARIRPDRRQRHSLLLSRLAVRRRRHDPRNARRARRQHTKGSAVPRRLPGARICRPGVRLYGTAGARSRHFPILDTYDLPGYQLVARAPTLWDCNWLQVKENSMDPAHVAFLHTLPGSEGFTEDFKELAEWDWMETPVGMVYIDTRRHEDKVWVRVADFILPNIHQFPPNMRPGGAPQRHKPPAGHHLGGAAGRYPHDADRLLPRARGQGPAARHRVRPGRQPLLRGTPTCPRRLGRPGEHPWRNGAARAGASGLHRPRHHHDAQHDPPRHPRRQDGEDLGYRILHNGAAVPTYSHDRVVAGIPPAATPEADKELLREVARTVVAGTIEAGSAEA